ncbi:MAG: hypothetical protein H6672_12645 [Anaerolineaceae bacterium]|nr:hypothetical protein [Anaerolineaceae bacterium]
MLRILSSVVLLCLLMSIVAAQTNPTPVTLNPDDPRPAVCAAPSLPNFTAHIVRPGERLVDLLRGTSGFSLTQIAALNCLDDPAALPIGAVIWLPRSAPDLITAPPFDSDPTTDTVEILSFAASSPTTNNEAGISFNWEAVGTVAYFYSCPLASEAPCPRPVDANPVPLTYTTPVFGGFLAAGPVRYRLEVVDGEAVATQDVTVNITCAQAVLGIFSDYQVCPSAAPLYTSAAWQPFESGVMIWWSDTLQIWVLNSADHSVRVYDDTYQEGDPDPTDQAPEGLITPVRGFGKLWAALGGAESPLGWALSPEIGYQVARQPAGDVSYTTYLRGPDENVYAVTFVPGQDAGFWLALSE